MLKKVDLTKGNLPLVIIKFALPFVGMNFLYAALGITDLFIIGNFMKDPAAISAVSIGVSITFLFLLFAVGMMAGGTIMVGRTFKAKKYHDLKQIVGTLMSSFVILGALSMLVLVFFAPFFAELLQTPAEAKVAAVNYVRIYGIGFFFFCLSLSISSVMRGLGISMTVLISVSFSTFLNIIFDILFICVFGWGVEGSAIATGVAEILGLVFIVWYLRFRKFSFRFYFKDFRFNKAKAFELLKLGTPISMQSVLSGLSFWVLASLANRLGTEASAAYGIGQRIWDIALIPTLSFGMAMSAITAQNMGAKAYNRAKAALYEGTLFSSLFSLAIFVPIFFFPERVVSIFTSDPATSKAGIDFIVAHSWDLWIIPLVYCFLNFFNACGHTLLTMLISLGTAFLVRVPVAVILTLPAAATLFDLGLAGPITSAVQAGIFVLYYVFGRWKKYGIKKE